MTTTAPVPTRGDDALRRLDDLHDFLDQHRDEVVALLTDVSTHRAATYEVESALQTLRGAAAEVERWRPPRIGRVAVFMPSNVLLYSYVLYGLVPALYADEVVLRPSSQVAATLLRLHALLAPHHGLPVRLAETNQREFVEQVVPAAAAVVFCGAYPNAERVRAELRDDQLFAFLGSGINPVVVHPGADLDDVVADLLAVRLLNSGQDCLGPDAIWVHEDLLPDLTLRLGLALATLRFGPNTEAEADYGPVHYAGVLRHCAEFFDAHRDQIVVGGRIDFAHRQVEPTLLVWDDPGAMRTPEFFAPVFNVCSYPDEHVLLARLNSSYYCERAMGASVYGTAPRVVEALSRRHCVSLGTSLLSLDDGNAPLGGRGAMASYVALGRRVSCEPVLLSKALAEHAPRPGGVSA